MINSDDESRRHLTLSCSKVVALVADIFYRKVGRHYGGCRVVFKFGRPASEVVLLISACFLEVSDPAFVPHRGVVGQADVEEARVLLRLEMVHVAH